jgi:ketosteroid isomerase-like protein
MSEEHVDKARAFIDAYNRRDFDAAVADFDPGIEWILPDDMGADSCQGPGAIIRFWEGLDETFDELQLLPQEFVDAGDHVATRLRHYGQGKRSGVVIDEELYHQVATFRDGVIVRMEYFADWTDARAAAGVASPGSDNTATINSANR